MKIKRIITILLVFSLFFGTLVTNSNITYANTLVTNSQKQVKLSKKKLTLDKSGTYIKTLTLKNAKQKVKWSTSNKKIVVIDYKYGKKQRKADIRGKKAGTAIITAKCAGKKYKCKVIVKPKKTNSSNNSSTNSNSNTSTTPPKTTPTTTNSSSENNNPNTSTSNNNYGILNMDVSCTDVVIGTSGSDKVIVSQSGYTGRYSFYYKIADTNIISCSWETLENGSAELYITGKKAGSTTITITNSINSQEIIINVTYKPIDIILPSTPITLNNYSYSNVLQQTYTLTDITYEINGSTVYLYFSGNKTYDYRGAGQSSKLSISWKLYKKGSATVIDSGTCLSSTIAIGESFENEKSYIWNLENGEYELKILNTN